MKPQFDQNSSFLEISGIVKGFFHQGLSIFQLIQWVKSVQI